MENYKGKLLEYCAKNIIAPPVFSSSMMDGFWKCNVVFQQFDITTKPIPGKKIQAEQEASRLILELVQNQHQSHHSHQIPLENVVMIDLENIPWDKSNEIPPKTLILGFTSVNHHSIGKYDDWEHLSHPNQIETRKSDLLLFKIEGGYADLVDHFLTSFTFYLASYLKSTNQSPKVFILSKDKAAYCSESCLKYFNLTLKTRVISKYSMIFEN